MFYTALYGLLNLGKRKLGGEMDRTSFAERDGKPRCFLIGMFQQARVYKFQAHTKGGNVQSIDRI